MYCSGSTIAPNYSFLSTGNCPRHLANGRRRNRLDKAGVLTLIFQYVKLDERARPHSWETNLGHELPVNRAKTGNSTSQKHFKTCSGYFVTHIYLSITRCLTSILALNNFFFKSVSLWLVTYVFHVTYESVFFTTLL